MVVDVYKVMIAFGIVIADERGLAAVSAAVDSGLFV
jgi:hypothetical protein